MLRVEHETFHSAKSASVYLGITRGMFYRNVKPLINKYQQTAGKRLLYKQSDLEKYCSIELVTS